MDVGLRCGPRSVNHHKWHASEWAEDDGSLVRPCEQVEVDITALLVRLNTAAGSRSGDDEDEVVMLSRDLRALGKEIVALRRAAA